MLQGVGHGIAMMSEGGGFGTTQAERGEEGIKEGGQGMQDAKRVEQLPRSHHPRLSSSLPTLRTGRRAGMTAFLALAARMIHAWRVEGGGALQL